MYLLLWTLVFFSTLVGASEPPTTISQMIIVHSPANDVRHGAFFTLGQDLSALLAAAQAKHLKVVLVNADSLSSNLDLRKVIRDLVQRENSWLILATHGEGVKSADGHQTLDTNLSFNGGVTVGELSEDLSVKNVKGLVVAACHSHSRALIGIKNTTCAISSGDKVAFNGLGNVSAYRALAKVVSSDVPLKIGQTLSKEMEAAINQNPKLADQMINDDGKKINPVSYHDDKEYRFAGQAYSITDEAGSPIVPCENKIGFKSLERLMRVTDYLKGPVRLFPGKYPFVDRELRSYNTSAEVTCGTDGTFKIKIAPRLGCADDGAILSLEDCANGANEDGWPWKVENKRSQCRELRSVVDEAKKHGTVIVGAVCISSCSDDRLRTNISPGKCLSFGQGIYCSLGHESQDQEKCCGFGHTYSWNKAAEKCEVACYDRVKKKKVHAGECYALELPVRKESDAFVYEDDPIFECHFEAGFSRYTTAPKCCPSRRKYVNGDCLPQSPLSSELKQSNPNRDNSGQTHR